MKFNKIKSVLLSVTVGGMVTVTSCNDYLEVVNPSTSSQEIVFSNVRFTEAALTATYNKLMGDFGYGARLAFYIPSADDFSFLAEWDQDNRTAFGHFGVGPGNTDIYNSLVQLYEGIERANVVIKNIRISPLYTNGTPQQQATMRKFLGEALTLRAQFYYEIIRNWGDAPAMFEPASDTQNLFVEKTDRDVIYDRILSDLLEAQDLVPWRNESNDPVTRVTKAAVKALRARIALAAGGYSLRKEPKAMARRSDYKKYYQIARDECWDIIQHGDNRLNPSFENVFRALHGAGIQDETREIIWRIGADANSASTDSKLGIQAGPRHLAGRYGGANTLAEAVPTYFYAFDSIADTRRDVTIAYFQVNAVGPETVKQVISPWRHGKFRKYWADPSKWAGTNYAGIDWPMIRYADVLLMFAEAENEISGGATGPAIQAFEEVRKRAYSAEWRDRMGVTPTGKDEFFKAIVNERYLELGGEGLRRYDLIRWNLLSTVIRETREKLVEMRNQTGRYANVPARVFYRATPLIGESTTAHHEMQTLDLLGASGGNPIASVMYQPAPTTSAPEGYTSVNWGLSVSEQLATSPTRIFASQFRENDRELLPFPTRFLNSNAKLTQDFGVGQ
ncbi:RagB/SusD family nutrient uptake outer membrane protein [Rufibacter roseus]|uniref:RagB/SusD family nutrient uptake outer membrane protein n=1 Tax=Rufibacter roseus TaxID=1567108 RepID=A0ABW2DPG8_9BACT|nr:RagB/SusD family nutrient uptake outer membrane protein [Rufibacter roseus]